MLHGFVGSREHLLYLRPNLADGTLALAHFLTQPARLDIAGIEIDRLPDQSIGLLECAVPAELRGVDDQLDSFLFLQFREHGLHIELDIFKTLVSGIPIPLQQLTQDLIQLLRALGHEVRQWWWSRAHHFEHDRRRATSVKGILAGDELIIDDAVGPDIAERIDLTIVQLLRGHVVQSSYQESRLGKV